MSTNSSERAAGPALGSAGPASSSASGPSYTQPFKALTLLIAIGLGVFFIYTYLGGGLDAGLNAGLDAQRSANRVHTGINQGLGWFIAAYALVLLFTWFIVTGRSSLSDDELTQTWVWQKKVLVSEIAFARFIYYPSFAWLVAPRLYLMLAGGRITTIYIANPELYTKAIEIAARYRR
jgi:hypothetical protein